MQLQIKLQAAKLGYAGLPVGSHPRVRVGCAVTLSSCATAMSVLQVFEQMHTNLNAFMNHRDMRRLVACGPGFVKLLHDQRRVCRLLRHGRVQHAFHLVPECFLLPHEQMFLAPVNKLFYSSGLQWYGTQTLVPWEVRCLQRVYEAHLGIPWAVRSSNCSACDRNKILPDTGMERDIEQHLRTGLCCDCAAILQQNLRLDVKMRQCQRLNELGCTYFKEWLSLSQARESLRFENAVLFDRALLLARERIALGCPWRQGT